jgi:hypothetical protein
MEPIQDDPQWCPTCGRVKRLPFDANYRLCPDPFHGEPIQDDIETPLIPRAELERALAAAQTAIQGYGKLAEDYEELVAERDRLIQALEDVADKYEKDGEPGPFGLNCWGWRTIAQEIRRVARSEALTKKDEETDSPSTDV